MNSQLSNEPVKDKKKSFIERLFNFASHTMKFNKKAAKNQKTNQKLIERISTAPLISSRDESENCTFTFCDYCDGVICAKFTGQNIICHDSCKDRHMETIKVANSDINSFLDSSNSNSETYGSTIDEHDIFSNRFLSSGKEVKLFNIPYADDTLDQSISDLSSFDTVRSTFALSGSESDSYTFSTADLSTIRDRGISIKKVPSFSENVFKNLDIQQGNKNTLITLSRNSFDKSTLPDDLSNLIQIFNNNDQGLFIEEFNDQIMGKVRVYINLLRPIKMLLTARPPYTFDMLSDSDKDKQTIERAYYNRESIFWLPRGTTHLLYVNINCTTFDLITMLLAKFNIQNNPKKFALYEHTQVSSTEVEVRKFKPNQCPLKIMLEWCLNGKSEYENILKKKRFVLQENDPGFIEWNNFSIPELNSFLKILIQEEEDKKEQISRRFGILKSEILRHLNS